MVSIGSELDDQNNSFIQANLRTTFGKIPDSKPSKTKRKTAVFKPTDFPSYMYPSQTSLSQTKSKFTTQNSALSCSDPSQSNLYSKYTSSIAQKYLNSQTTTTNFDQKLDLSGVGLLSRQELIQLNNSRSPSKQIIPRNHLNRKNNRIRLKTTPSKSLSTKKSSKLSFILSKKSNKTSIRSKTLKHIRLFKKSGQNFFKNMTYSKVSDSYY